MAFIASNQRTVILTNECERVGTGCAGKPVHGVVERASSRDVRFKFLVTYLARQELRSNRVGFGGFPYCVVVTPYRTVQAFALIVIPRNVIFSRQSYHLPLLVS